MTRNRVFLLAAAAVVILDRVTKAMVVARMSLGESIPLVDSFLSLTYITNTGIAFGLFNTGSGTLKTLILGSATAAALGVMVWLLVEMERGDLLGGTAVGMVAGGAVGNFIDRVRTGEVIDFIDVYWRHHHWPAFNAADSAISVGVTLLIAHQVFSRGKREAA